MDKVLIVDDNLEFLGILKEGLQHYSGQFEALFASDVNEAVIKLKREDISILVTDLKMPKVDGLALLAYMSNDYPKIPCIVMTGYGNPAVRKKIDEKDIFSYIEKPFDFNELAEAIIEALDIRDEFASLKDISGISVTSFLQLIEMEKKTCLLEVDSNNNGGGILYFNNGILYDALYGSLKGEAAVLEILGWDRVRFRFKRLPKKKIKQQIDADLTSLILESMGSKDESIKADKKSIQKKIGETEGVITHELDASRSEEGDEINEQTASSQKSFVKFSKQKNINEERRHKKMALENAVLDPLKDISGFLGASVYTGSGELLISEAPEAMNIEKVAGLAVELYKNARAIAEQIEIGVADLVEVRTETHYFLHACIVPGKGGMGLLMQRDGNVGLMRLTMRKIAESLVPDFS